MKDLFKNKLLLLLVILPGICLASGVPESPVAPHPDAATMREIQNLYQAIKNPVVNTITASSATISSVTVTGRLTVPNGSAVTDAIAYGQLAVSTFTPSVVGAGTISNASGFYQQIGPMIHAWGSFLSGTSTAVSVKIAVPTGSIIYTNRLPTNATGRVGISVIQNGAPTAVFGNTIGTVLFADGTDTAYVYWAYQGNTSGNAYAKVNGSAIMAGYVDFDFWYAIN